MLFQAGYLTNQCEVLVQIPFCTEISRFVEPASHKAFKMFFFMLLWSYFTFELFAVSLLSTVIPKYVIPEQRHVIAVLYLIIPFLKLCPYFQRLFEFNFLETTSCLRFTDLIIFLTVCDHRVFIVILILGWLNEVLPSGLTPL